MIRIENEDWYTAVDIALSLNENREGFEELKKCFRHTFGWSNSHFISFQYIQNLLSKAKKSGEIRYCKYYRNGCGRPNYVYTLPDLINWIRKEEQKMIDKYEIVEVAG